MSTPLVSVLIPLYNAQEYISATLESVLNQTYTNIEIIIVDDGSSDNSIEIVKSYQQRYSNIALYTQPNSGASRARDRAFELSKGDYINYLDSDDLLSSNKIASQIELLREFDFDKTTVAFCKFAYFVDTIDSAEVINQPINHSFESGIKWLKDSFEGGGYGAVMGWLTPRDLIYKAGSWRNDLKRNQDGEFFARVLVNAAKVVYDDNSIVYYRKGIDSSISSNNSYRAIESILQSYIYYTTLNKPQLNQSIAYKFIDFIIHYRYTYPNLAKKAYKEIEKLDIDINSIELKGKSKYLSKLFGTKIAIETKAFIKYYTKFIYS